MIIATLKIQLGAHPWMAETTRRGKVWENYSLDQEIVIVAIDNDDPQNAEWAAYYQSPELPASSEEVAGYGRKLPEAVARELFSFIKSRYRP